MIVIVHGYDGSGPGHWQHWLAGELDRRRVRASFPQLPAPTAPEPDAWVGELHQLVVQAGQPVYFVAHSLGCWAVDHLIAQRGAAGIAGALLVSPPSPFSLFEPIQTFLPPPRSPEAWAPIAGRSLLLGSDNDEYSGPDEFDELATRLRLPFRLVPGAGHINAAAGFGPFPLALDWLSSVGAL